MSDINPKIYLDFAASAPLREIAWQTQTDYRSRSWACANPNSLHSLGRLAARDLESARSIVAHVLGGGFRPGDVAFTGGGTEANNIGILGIALGVKARDHHRSTVILSAIEHDSVLDLARPLRERGFEVRLVRPAQNGVIEPKALSSHLSRSVALVSVMSANNETGVVQPIDRLAQLAHEAGACFFTDAIQAFCHVPLELAHVDGLSLAAHKIGALPGVGALVIRRRCPFAPQSFGGGQERGMRAGTQDVAGALAFAKTADTLKERLLSDETATSKRANRLSERLKALSGVALTSELSYTGHSRLPGIVSITVKGLESETLVLGLDEAGFEVSAGSACSSASLDPSHVLVAMGIPKDRAFGALRISFDERVHEAELDAFACAFEALLNSHRAPRLHGFSNRP